MPAIQTPPSCRGIKSFSTTIFLRHLSCFFASWGLFFARLYVCKSTVILLNLGDLSGERTALSVMLAWRFVSKKLKLLPRALGPTKTSRNCLKEWPNELLRHFEAPGTRYRYLSKKSVCFLMHKFYHDLREWMYYFWWFRNTKLRGKEQFSRKCRMLQIWVLCMKIENRTASMVWSFTVCHMKPHTLIQETLFNKH